uniref:ORF79 n=1 Tax=Malaco herpesvirus 1 TaxID=3031797 RepID=A0AA48SF12_9VIRU|nr:TPA_asm: ORF79 [Malaco herpesvirus 1]
MKPTYAPLNPNKQMYFKLKNFRGSIHDKRKNHILSLCGKFVMSVMAEEGEFKTVQVVNLTDNVIPGDVLVTELKRCGISTPIRANTIIPTGELQRMTTVLKTIVDEQASLNQKMSRAVNAITEIQKRKGKLDQAVSMLYTGLNNCINKK